eukprot:TRINITY_DN1257_c0_g1_i1.p1 TRINITY_DN1257_c0_g1~~TRINITY_DN1257_c0_g1_i1.p1  ORF type:complete len:417 (-),score=157.11 TRINITY_DN1257_c0_g1_i1:28-1278(-)
MERRTRSSRRSSKKVQQPSEVWYLGYVEDGESVEMIEKKFEALEQYKKQQETKKQNEEENEEDNNNNEDKKEVDQKLSEEQLQEMFKLTSNFTVQTIGNNNNEVFFEEDILLLKEFGFDSDEEDDECEWNYNRPKGTKKRKRSGKNSSSKKSKVPRKRQKYVSYEFEADGSVFTIKRKIRKIDPLAFQYSRVPTPLPLSWGNIMSPYSNNKNNNNEESDRMFSCNILKENLTNYGDNFLAILMDPPWRSSNSESTEGITPKEFSKLKINEKLIPVGFIFCWILKEYISEVFDQMEKWGFLYVENFCWVKKRVNNQLVHEPSKYFRSSKESLMIFRKRTSQAVELKHQRNPDVAYEYVKQTPGRITQDKPDVQYKIIETLLPEAELTEESNKCRLLELWSNETKGIRPGWISVNDEN